LPSFESSHNLPSTVFETTQSYIETTPTTSSNTMVCQELLEFRKWREQREREFNETVDREEKKLDELLEILTKLTEQMDRLEEARRRSPPMRVSPYRRSRPSSKHRKPLGRLSMNHKKKT
jgi:exonuclease VII large subunit